MSHFVHMKPVKWILQCLSCSQLSSPLTDTRKLCSGGCRTPVHLLESFPDKRVAEWIHTCCNPSAVVLYSTMSRSAAVVWPGI